MEECPFQKKRSGVLRQAAPRITRAGNLLFYLPEDERSHGTIYKGNALSLGKGKRVRRIVWGEKRFLSKTFPAAPGSSGKKSFLPKKKGFYPPFTRTTTGELGPHAKRGPSFYEENVLSQ